MYSATRRRASRLLGWTIALSLACINFGCTSAALPSWRDGQARSAVLQFIERTTDADSPDFVPPADRIAVFDNDGTLWAEQPAYFQLLFAIHRVRELAPQRPEWSTTEPFRTVLQGDMHALARQGEEALAKLVAATHSGLTTDQFADAVRRWLASARHPTLDRPFTACVYQPMLELLDHLRANGYRTYIVSGGGIQFMRVFAEEVYGVPPEQVIGSRAAVALETRDGVPVLVKRPAIEFIDDKAGKPIAINLHIGRRPVMAFGNSDGDLDMLLWTTSRTGPSFAALIHHDDADREWAYDRASHIGRLDAALNQAPARGWTIVSMRRDWESVFPPQSAPQP